MKVVLVKKGKLLSRNRERYEQVRWGYIMMFYGSTVIKNEESTMVDDRVAPLSSCGSGSVFLNYVLMMNFLVDTIW